MSTTSNLKLTLLDEKTLIDNGILNTNYTLIDNAFANSGGTSIEAVGYNSLGKFTMNSYKTVDYAKGSKYQETVNFSKPIDLSKVSYLEIEGALYNTGVVSSSSTSNIDMEVDLYLSDGTRVYEISTTAPQANSTTVSGHLFKHKAFTGGSFFTYSRYSHGACTPNDNSMLDGFGSIASATLPTSGIITHCIIRSANYGSFAYKIGPCIIKLKAWCK